MPSLLSSLVSKNYLGKEILPTTVNGQFCPYVLTLALYL